MKRKNIAYCLALLLLLLLCSVGDAELIRRTTIARVAAQAPIIVLGERADTNATQSDGGIYGIPDSMSRDGISVKTVKLSVDSVLKGTVDASTVSVYVVSAPLGFPYANLRHGSQYVLFLSPVENGLRLCDPVNAALLVSPGATVPDGTNLTGKLRCVMEGNLNSTNERVVFSGLLALAELGNQETLPKVTPFSTNQNILLSAAAAGTRLKLRDWSAAAAAVRCVASNNYAIESGTIDASIGFFSLNPVRNIDDGLGSITNREALSMLLDAVNVLKAGRTKCMAIRSLGTMRGPKVIPALLALVDDEDADVSYEAYRSLALMCELAHFVGQDSFAGEQKTLEIQRLRLQAEKQLR